MRILACEDRTAIGMSLAFSRTVIGAVAGEGSLSFRWFASHRAGTVFRALAVRLWWLVDGVRRIRTARREGREEDSLARHSLARAFPCAMPSGGEASKPARPRKVESPDAGPALKTAAARLLSLQGEDGAWEGEMVWCPMLTAQYALLHHIIGRPLDPGRRRRVLRSFERTRLAGGAWGLHEHSPPHLFVTALVYVAARLLGIKRDDPLVEPAGRFIRAEGILGIPSWGKFWLALLNLYDWRGVNAVLPELWSLPRRVPLHPSNWYCHTRLIYMAMAVIYARRFQAPVTPLIESLRQELFPQGFAGVDFFAARNRLREADLYRRPSLWLRAGYGLARLFDRFHAKRLRARCTEALVGRIKWELRTTSHTSISPVSGLLNILALWLHDPNDADCERALAQLDDWIWEDEDEGARVTGARSASWDTGFALQALAALPEPAGIGDALRRGAGFLRGEQIDTSFAGFREAYRIDPRGGWCFAGGWHGWPVSDCTAEAVLGLVAAGGADRAALGDAVAFMLRAQNRDGGFGSYEARRSAFGLEWLNPAEMFGDSMTEHSFVECTASCLAALAACEEQFPEIADGRRAGAVSRAESWLRRTQVTDGSWRGVWGVQFIYGTLFGIRGLLAAGASPGDPALRSACRWLLERQREDGGWGEHHSGCLTGRYVPHGESQVIQTAWALIALLEAGDPDWAAISRGAQFLLDTQDAEGPGPNRTWRACSSERRCSTTCSTASISRCTRSGSMSGGGGTGSILPLLLSAAAGRRPCRKRHPPVPCPRAPAALRPKMRRVQPPECGGLRTRKKNIGVKMPAFPPSTSALPPSCRNVLTAVAPSGRSRVLSAILNATLVRMPPMVVREILVRLRSRFSNARYQGIFGCESKARSRVSSISNPAARNAVQTSDVRSMSGSPSPLMIDFLIR